MPPVIMHVHVVCMLMHNPLCKVYAVTIQQPPLYPVLCPVGLWTQHIVFKVELCSVICVVCDYSVMSKVTRAYPLLVWGVTLGLPTP